MTVCSFYHQRNKSFSSSTSSTWWFSVFLCFMLLQTAYFEVLNCWFEETRLWKRSRCTRWAYIAIFLLLLKVKVLKWDNGHVSVIYEVQAAIHCCSCSGFSYLLTYNLLVVWVICELIVCEAAAINWFSLFYNILIICGIKYEVQRVF